MTSNPSIQPPQPQSAAGAAATPAQPPAYRRFLQGSVAAMAGGAASHPLDLLKVRMQIQGESAAAAAAGEAGQRLGMLGMAKHIVQHEGAAGLFAGVTASLLRQCVYSGARFGAYDTLKTDVFGEDLASGRQLAVWQKVASGMIAGAFGATVGNPADVAMVRMQADGKLPAAERRGYGNAADALVRITREEGVLSLWNGCGPTVARAMVVTASQLAAYDTIKQELLDTGGFADRPSTHLFAGFLAGFVASCTTNPLDVIKTRVMNAPPGLYRGPIDCTMRTVRSEGPLALYKGFVPTFTRQAPYVIVTFLTLEQCKKAWKRLDGEA